MRLFIRKFKIQTFFNFHRSLTGCCEAGELRLTDRARYQEQACAGTGSTSERTDGTNGSPDARHGDILANEGERVHETSVRSPCTCHEDVRTSGNRRTNARTKSLHVPRGRERAHERAHEVSACATRTYERTNARTRVGRVMAGCNESRRGQGS